MLFIFREDTMITRDDWKAVCVGMVTTGHGLDFDYKDQKKVTN